MLGGDFDVVNKELVQRGERGIMWWYNKITKNIYIFSFKLINEIKF